MDMEVVTPTQSEIKLLIDNALLQNNEKLIEKFNLALKDSARAITESVNGKTEPVLNELLTLSEKYGTLKAEQDTLSGRLSLIWAKLIALGTACATLGGFVTFLILQLVKVH